MTQDAMQRRYNELYEKAKWQTPTSEEITESVFLYYKAYPDGIQSFAHRNTTPEQTYGLCWCDACGRAHKPPAHTGTP